jgi:hypothetical protein
MSGLTHQTWGHGGFLLFAGFTQEKAPPLFRLFFELLRSAKAYGNIRFLAKDIRHGFIVPGVGG